MHSPLWKRKRTKPGKEENETAIETKRLRLTTPAQECIKPENSEKTFEYESYGYLEASGLKTCAKEKIEYKSKQSDLNSAEFDNWNEEFQRYYDMPTDTPRQRLKRARRIHVIYDRFLQVAKEVAKTIIAEVGTSNKTISSSQVGGIASGEKFSTRGIFFKFVRDLYGIYGGDHFSMKAAGHEIGSVNALLQCSITELHLPMVCVIDYWGYRVFAEAVLPLSKFTICYGSCNGGMTVHNSDPKMHEIMEQAGKALNLAQHIVADGWSPKPCPLIGPCDIEGHKGTDGRYYLVDTARLFPSEGRFDTLFAVRVAVDGTLSTLQLRKEGHSVSSADIEQALHLNDSSSPEHQWEESHFPDSLITLYRVRKGADPINPLSSTTNVDPPDSSTQTSLPFNKRASCITGAPIFGDVLLVHCSSMQMFYHLLRPEIVKQSPRPLSSDAFSSFGAHSREVFEADVTEMTNLLRNKIIPEFAAYINDHVDAVVSGLHLPEQMHRQGINLRYLGYLFRLLKNERVKYHCVGFQMIARVLKNQLRAKLRNQTINSDEKYHTAVVDFFNLVFGENQLSADFWEMAVPVHILLKYGPFGFTIDDIIDFKAILGKLPLFHMLQEYTGVRFNLDLPNVRERLSAKDGTQRFDHSELAGMHALVKKVDIRSNLQPILLECCQLVANEGEVAVLFKRWHLTCKIYGPLSIEAAASAILLADGLSRESNHASAEFYSRECLKAMAAAGEIPGEVLLGSLYLMGLCAERVAQDDTAERIYCTILTLVLELYDSQEDPDSASPFELELVSRIASLMERRGQHQLAATHRARGQVLAAIFPHTDSAKYAYECALGYLSFKDLSGYNLSVEDAELDKFLVEEQK